MAALHPGPAFAGAALDLSTIPQGALFGRIFHARHADPLGIGKLPSRFSDPRRRMPLTRFGVLYLGSTLRVCFIEAVLRDLRNGAVADYPIEERELLRRNYAQITVAAPLRMVDLRADGAVRMGVPSDVARGSRQGLARQWSVAFHDHPAAPDGIVYPSRLNGETNLAVYDRAIAKLGAAHTVPLISAPGFGPLLESLKVALI